MWFVVFNHAQIRPTLLGQNTPVQLNNQLLLPMALLSQITMVPVHLSF